MSNELPYLPFFVGDFLVTVGTWPVDRVGAYALALFYQFEHGGVPADDESELARILHVGRQTARRLWADIQSKPKFHKHDDGLWWNPRMEEVRSTARTQRTLATNRARNAAGARWGKGANSMPAPSMLAPSNAQAVLEDMLGDASKVKESTSTLPTLPKKGGFPKTPRKPSSRRLRRPNRRSAADDRDAEQLRKTQEVKRLIQSGMTLVDANRQVFGE